MCGCLLIIPIAHAQETPAKAASLPAPRPDDVKSIDGIVAALYETVSGEKGHPRDWDRLRSLFAPDARMILAAPARGEDRPARLRSMDLETFIKGADANSRREAFYESEVARRTDRFGGMANVWSTYESRIDPKAAPFGKGINSFELFHDGKRWWVVSVYWTVETADQPIPEKYQSTK